MPALRMLALPLRIGALMTLCALAVWLIAVAIGLPAHAADGIAVPVGDWTTAVLAFAQKREPTFTGE